MQNKFTQFVTKHEVIAPKTSAILASFCHFDAKSEIADYVVFAVKSLKEAGTDVYFVSNNENITEIELAKIRPYVAEIILRKNIGYDFAAYFTGYAYAADKGYEQVIFVNDSVYGPLYSLAPILKKMSAYDMWGITDAKAGNYHIQSYFWVFSNLNFLDEQTNKFEFISDKSQVVGRYEEGITQDLIKQNFKIGVYCPKHEITNDDETLRRLKNNIRTLAEEKINFSRKVKGWLNKNTRLRNKVKIINQANHTGIFSNWYELVKYQNCPFFKVGMLKKPNMAKYHENEYIELIQSKYPDFDLNLIANHLKRSA